MYVSTHGNKYEYEYETVSLVSGPLDDETKGKNRFVSATSASQAISIDQFRSVLDRWLGLA